LVIIAGSKIVENQTVFIGIRFGCNCV